MNFEKIKTNPMFNNICENDINKILTCFGASEKSYSKGEIIILAGTAAENIGLITKGSIHLIREDYDGNRTIVAKLTEGEIFAEAFAFAYSVKALPVTVYAETDCSVMFLNCRKITDACPVSCPCHIKFIENMLSLISEKNIMLNRRIGHLSKRTTTEKLMSYLSEQAALSGDKSFCIPFNRQQLADYLCVERSAMSAVLSKLKQDRIIDYQKNRFTFLENSELLL